MKNTGRKKRLALLRAFLLWLGLYLGSGALPVQAAQHTASCGNLIYEDGSRSACLYAADILLLEEKISSIPERGFDPLCYAHTHNWEYRNITEHTHTRHCADCGDINDLTGAHRAERWERDTIFYEGITYPGTRYTCACGYQWRRELSHNLLYEATDEISHRCRCALDGTPYCTGCEPSVEEHYAWYYEMGEDDLHHTKICFDCGCQIEEECYFFEGEDGSDPSACVCGRNAPSEAPDVGEAPELPDPEEEPEKPGISDSETEPGEADKPDDSDPEEEPDESDKPDDSDTEKKPEESGDSDPATEPAEPDKPDPETGPTQPDKSEAEDDSETPDGEIIEFSEYIECIPLY